MLLVVVGGLINVLLVVVGGLINVLLVVVGGLINVSAAWKRMLGTITTCNTSCATLCEGTAQLLNLTELKSHRFVKSLFTFLKTFTAKQTLQYYVFTLTTLLHHPVHTSHLPPCDITPYISHTCHPLMSLRTYVTLTTL